MKDKLINKAITCKTVVQFLSLFFVIFFICIKIKPNMVNAYTAI